MRSFDIALKNIKKSRSDYSIYFFTLILGVTIFYMFNAVGTQGIMKKAMCSSNTAVDNFVTVIGMVSVAVVIIFGLLIIYANNFLIKRRKKEFGIYMLLGMNSSKVARILLYETCIVGFFSLVIGILLGMVASQCLSVIVAKMFMMDLSDFKFDISVQALEKTLLCFIGIYIVVFLLNKRSVKKNKLIDLLTASKKSEKEVLKNSSASLALFAISIVGLVYAWIRVGFDGENLTIKAFLICVVMGFVCTFLFFRSAGGFLQKAGSSCRKFYTKGLNAFVVRQFTAGVNTSSISMAVISLLLFLALLFFSTGFSIRNYFNARLGNHTPVDITMDLFSLEPDSFFEEHDIPMDEWSSDHLMIPIYKEEEVTLRTLLGNHIEEASETFRMAEWDSMVGVMSLSEYNLIEDMYGRDRIEMNDDQYAFILDFDLMGEIVNGALRDGNKLKVSGAELSPAYDHVIPECVLMSGMEANLGIVILPDRVLASPECGLEQVSSFIAANYASEEAGASAESVLSELEDDVFYTTKNEIRSSSIGMTVIIVFVVLYLGIVFVISSAAIIGLKMLSDSIDSASHFTILKNIGASTHDRKKALFTRVFSFFMFPLALAIIDTFFGVRFVKGFMNAIGMINMAQGIALSLFIMVLIYGGYFLTTYEGCRKIVGI
ncbi:MAG: FtsX-like permease family protein [Lachnospiraceae bacterium]|nr:FtsX-like permease family protein [Lachnospiraceae bacterium]